MTQIRYIWETSVIISIIYTSFLSALIGKIEKNHEKSAFGCIATDKLEWQLDGHLQLVRENMQRIQWFYKENANITVIITLYEQWRHILGSREQSAAMIVYFHNDCIFPTVI